MATIRPVSGHRDLKSGKPPLIVAHGGPGCTHDYVDSFKDIAATGRAVIHYDQWAMANPRICPKRAATSGRWSSSRRSCTTSSTTSASAERLLLLGQSWGGMLGAEFSVDQPEGLKALVIANSPAAMHTWISEANRLREELPPEVQATLLKHEQAGTTDSAEIYGGDRCLHTNGMSAASCPCRPRSSAPSTRLPKIPPSITR